MPHYPHTHLLAHSYTPAPTYVIDRLIAAKAAGVDKFIVNSDGNVVSGALSVTGPSTLGNIVVSGPVARVGFLTAAS